MYKLIQNISEQIGILKEGFEKFEKERDNDRKRLDKVENRLNKQGIIQSFILVFVSVVLIACFLTFVTLTIDYFNFTSDKRENFQKSREERIIINSRLDDIEDKLQQLSDTTSN